MQARLVVEEDPELFLDELNAVLKELGDRVQEVKYGPFVLPEFGGRLSALVLYDDGEGVAERWGGEFKP